MAGEIRVTICGALTKDVETRFTPAGKPVASFTVASNPRTYNSQTQAWDDGSPTFMRCEVWNKQAENVAGSLRKGDRVVVTGVLFQEDWTDGQGNKRTGMKMRIEEVGASLLFRTFEHSRKDAAPTPGPDPFHVAPASTGWDEPPF